MNTSLLKSYWDDILCLTLFPKRYKPPEGRPRAFWGRVAVNYGNTMKKIGYSQSHWRIITYDDGRRELAFLRTLKGGLLSGHHPAIYRGILIPKMVDYGTFAHITSIEIAF